MLQQQLVGGDARIVDQYIQPPEGGGCILNELLAGLWAAYIRLQGHCLYAERAAVSSGLFGCCGAAGIVDGNIHALGSQCQTGGAANAARPAGHQCGAARCFALYHGLTLLVMCG